AERAWRAGAYLVPAGHRWRVGAIHAAGGARWLGRLRPSRAQPRLAAGRRRGGPARRGGGGAIGHDGNVALSSRTERPALTGWGAKTFAPPCRVQPITPSLRPTVVNAAIARSRCSRVCAALIWVRMRAWPCGTTR